MSERLPCERSWQAEAILDGRLVDADRASFERHAAGCLACAREAEALGALYRTMQGIGGLPFSALDRRRMQAALLQRAHARRPDARPHRRASWVLVPFAAAVLTLVGWLIVRPGHRTGAAIAFVGGAPSGGVAPPTFEVVSLSGQTVTFKTDGGVTHTALVQGAAAFHVVHLTAGQRFLLDLPDGELEVHGTRFVVEVNMDRTQSVVVDEGLVALRIRGEGERFLHAGERWSAGLVAAQGAVPPSSAQVSPPLDPPERPVSAAPTDVGAPAATSLPKPVAAPSSTAGTPGSLASKDALRKAEADARFAAAMASFRSGQYAAASQQLAAFEQTFPEDFRCEDALFVRAVASARSGDGVGADALARTYLQRYPQGLRRREAEALSSDAGATP